MYRANKENTHDLCERRPCKLCGSYSAVCDWHTRIAVSVLCFFCLILLIEQVYWIGLDIS